MRDTLRQHIKGTSRLCLLFGIGIVASMLAGVDDAGAANWMYRRSYYSHELPREVQRHSPQPRSRSAYRPAYVGGGFGFGARGGYRINRIVINSGSSRDYTVIYEGWLDARP